MKNDRVISQLESWITVIKNIERDLSDLLKSLESGIVPTMNQLDEQKKKIERLMEIRRDLDEYDFLLKMGSESTERSLMDYVQRLKEVCDELEQAYNKSLESLKQFIKVKSDVNDFDNAIEPFRNKAVKQLEDESKVESLKDIDEYVSKASDYEMFLRAMNMLDSSDSKESQILDEEIPKRFSTYIYRGLILKKYSLTDSNATLVDVDQPTEFDNKTDVKAEDADTPSTEVETVNEDEKEEPSDSINEIIHPRIIRANEKAFGVKAFKGDFSSADLYFHLFVGIATLKAVTLNQAIRFFSIVGGDHRPTSINSNIEKLVRRGHLYEIAVKEKEESFYGVSSSSSWAFAKSSLRKMMDKFKIFDLPTKDSIPSWKAISETDLLWYNNRAEALISINEALNRLYDQETHSATVKKLRQIDEYFIIEDFNQESQSIKAILFPSGRIIDASIDEKLKQDEVWGLFLVGTPTKPQQKQLTNNYAWLDNRFFIFDTDTGEIKYLSSGKWVSASSLAEGVRASEEVATTQTDELDKKPEDNQKSDTKHQSDEATINPNDPDLTSQPETTRINVLAKDLLSSDDLEYVTNQMGKLIEALVEGGQIPEALALAKTTSLVPGKDKTEYQIIFDWMRHATGIPIEKLRYSSQYLGDLESAKISENRISSEMMLTMLQLSYIWALICPEQKYDYGLASYGKQVLENKTVFDYKPLFFTLESLHQKNIQGFSKQVLVLLHMQNDTDKIRETMSSRAEELMKKPNPTVVIPGVEQFFSVCFGLESDLFGLLKIVKDDDSKSIKRVRTVFNELFASKKAENNNLLVSDDDSIDAYIDNIWVKVRKHEMDISYRIRDNIRNNISRRLLLIAEWYEEKNNNNTVDEITLKTIDDHRRNIIETIETSLKSLISKKEPKSHEASYQIIIYSLKKIEEYLRFYGEQESKDIFTTFLKTRHVIVFEGKPVFDPKLSAIKNYEPWRNVIRHILDEKLSFDAVLEAIDNSESHGWYNNYGQYERVWEILHPEQQMVNLEDSKKRAQELAEREYRDFVSTLEMAFAYYRIDEYQAELFIDRANQNKNSFFDYAEYGKFSAFMNELINQVQIESSKRKKEYLLRLDIFKIGRAH